MSTTLEEVEAAYIAAKQRAFHSGTRGIATPEQWQAWEKEFRDTISKTKAEARVEVLREMADTLAGAEPQHLGGADEGLEYFDYGTGAEYGIDVAAAYLRNAANETAREAGIVSEGTTTGESND